MNEANLIAEGVQEGKVYLATEVRLYLSSQTHIYVRYS